MATRSALAMRNAMASQTVEGNIQRIAKALSLTVPGDTDRLPPTRDVETRRVRDHERLAAFLALVADRVAGKEETEDDDDASGDGGTDDEPTFGGHPLSAFDGLDDEAALSLDGVGAATLKKVKAAQRKAARKAER